MVGRALKMFATERVAFDGDLDNEIANVLHENNMRQPDHTAYAPAALRLPSYVEHADNTPEIGKLSAEAVVKSFEEAVSGIQAMREEMIGRVRECETLTRNALAVVAELDVLASRYRDEAKRVFVQIETSSAMVEEVRRTCSDMASKIATPSS